MVMYQCITWSKSPNKNTEWMLAWLPNCPPIQIDNGTVSNVCLKRLLLFYVDLGVCIYNALQFASSLVPLRTCETRALAH